jgi:hypothetical protein
LHAATRNVAGVTERVPIAAIEGHPCDLSDPRFRAFVSPKARIFAPALRSKRCVTITLHALWCKQHNVLARSVEMVSDAWVAC